MTIQTENLQPTWKDRRSLFDRRFMEQRQEDEIITFNRDRRFCGDRREGSERRATEMIDCNVNTTILTPEEIMVLLHEEF